MHYDQDSQEARSVSNEVDAKFRADKFTGDGRGPIGEEVLGLCESFQAAELESEVKQEREVA